MSHLYLHVPYCRQACVYCDFHFSTNLSRKGHVVGAMQEELRLRKDFFTQNGALHTIYLGGGTPSVLSEAELGGLFETILQLVEIASGAEITLEANPEDLSVENLKMWRSAGINRLSLGIQSFFEDDLKWMNRAHSGEDAARAVARAQDAGFTNLTLDLIFGMNNSTAERWEANLEKALALKVPHMSVYALTVEEKTVLAHQVRKGQTHLPSQEGYAEQFLHAHNRLTEAGYHHYELSNYALSGHEAVHNSAYWQGKPYVGIGPSAHGFDGKDRYWNVAHNHLYQQALQEGKLAEGGRETLSPRDQYHEYLMTHLRKADGIDVSRIEQEFVPNWSAEFMPYLTQIERQGLANFADNTLKLTPKGWLVSDQITAEFFLDEQE